MSTLKPTPEAPLDKAITEVLERLHVLEPEDKEYAQAADQLVKLHKLKLDADKLELEEISAAAKFELERQQQLFDQTIGQKPKPISRDTLAVAGANLLGIGLIIWHERDHVMNRTAIDFLKRLR